VELLSEGLGLLGTRHEHQIGGLGSFKIDNEYVITLGGTIIVDEVFEVDKKKRIEK
jgi:hypothetical protein